ncbi:MAG: polyprenyl diphosphate synthase [Microgenomates group bacterium]
MQKNASKIPKHVAIICDGNRRWARSHGWEVFRGHEHAVNKTIEPLVDRASELGIECVTFWIFSTENWDREKKEVEGLMNLFRSMFDKQIEKFHEKNMVVKHIGDIEQLAPDIQDRIKKGIEKTKNNTGMTVVVAMNYGGRNEIVRGVRDLVEEIKADGADFDTAQITEKYFERYLETSDFPYPDLIIRTSGEQRLSGFLLWSGQYAECYFPKVTFPDFTPEELDKAIAEYQSRERRFGSG